MNDMPNEPIHSPPGTRKLWLRLRESAGVWLMFSAICCGFASLYCALGFLWPPPGKPASLLLIEFAGLILAGLAGCLYRMALSVYRKAR